MQHDAKCLVVHHISALCEKSSKHLKIAEKTSRLFHIHCTPTQSRLLRVRQYATKPRLIGMEEMKKKSQRTQSASTPRVIGDASDNTVRFTPRKASRDKWGRGVVASVMTAMSLECYFTSERGTLEQRQHLRDWPTVESQLIRKAVR